MGRRKNNNPQLTGARGPGRKSRKQQPPERLDDSENSNSRNGTVPEPQPSLTKLAGREAKSKARMLMTKDLKAKPAQKVRTRDLTPPKIVVKPYDGEPLKSALKTSASPKQTTSSTISKLQRQRTASETKQNVDAGRKVKFSDDNEVREMTLSETEEDRQPLASTLMNILSSLSLSMPQTRSRKKKAAAITGTRKNRAKGKKTKDASTSAKSGADSDDDDDDDLELEIPEGTPIDLLHALVDLANRAQNADASTDSDDDDDDEADSSLPNGVVSVPDTSKSKSVAIKKKVVSKPKKLKAKPTAKKGTDADLFGEQDDQFSSQLLDNGEVGEIERLNEEVVAQAADPSPAKTSKPLPTNDLAALLRERMENESSSSDEDFEPSAAEVAEAELDTNLRPLESDASDDNMEATKAERKANSAVNHATASKNLQDATKNSDNISPKKQSSPIKSRRSIRTPPPSQHDAVEAVPSAAQPLTTQPSTVPENGDLVVSAINSSASVEPESSSTEHLMQSSNYPPQQQQQRMPEQLAIIESRIHETIQTLATFDQYQKNQAEAGQTVRARSYFVNNLVDDLCAYYSYNEFLMRQLVDLFQFGELIEFLEANEAPRPVTIRVNSLKARRKSLAEALIQRGVNLDPIPGEWTKVGLVIYDSKVPVGATPEYLAGHYMLQGASSLLPVMALAPKPGENILDMCAAPGGKSTHIAAVMKNTGMLVANDAQHARCKSIVANMSRMGVVNAIVSSVDGRKLPEMQQKYDRVLLDAPCSGTGVLSRDPSAKMSKKRK